LAEFEARTSYPVSGEPPAQLWINFESPSGGIGDPFDGEALGDLKDEAVRGGLITRLAEHLHRRYPRLSATDIADLLTEIDEQKATWSFSQIKNVVARKAEAMPRVFSSKKKTSGFDLPDDENQRAAFAFSTKTRLTARIGESTYDFENGDHGHAEDALIAKIDTLIGKGELKPSATELLLTINNSPCAARCAPNLADAQTRRWKFKRIVIRYANPHGSTDKAPKVFEGAAKQLIAAGIEMVPFEPREMMSDKEREALNADQNKRFNDFEARRERFRLPDAAAQKGASKGFSTSSSSSADRSRARSRTPRGADAGNGDKPKKPSRSPSPGDPGGLKRHTAKQSAKDAASASKRAKKPARGPRIQDDPDAYRELVETGDERAIEGMRFRVAHAPNDGSCFYHSVASLRGGQVRAVRLRAQVAQILTASGDQPMVLARVNDATQYAQAAEMEILANALGVSFVIYMFGAAWEDRCQVRRIGDADETYYFVQSLAHIQPLIYLGPARGTKGIAAVENDADVEEEDD
jgi:hypothetical protein